MFSPFRPTKDSGFTLLVNESVTLTVGADDYLLGRPDTEKVVVSKEQADYSILLIHEPDSGDDFVNSGIDLILSGHSHGGQVLLPFEQKINTAMSDKYYRGFYTLDNEERTQLYLNTGIGPTKYNICFAVPPGITVFTIGI